MMQSTIATAAAGGKERLRGKPRLSREQLNAIEDAWRAGWVKPTLQLYSVIPGNAHPREPASGEGGLLPAQRIVACPDRRAPGRYIIFRTFDAFCIREDGLESHEAWRDGIAAVRSDHAEFALLNQPWEPGEPIRFSHCGAQCLIHPDGDGWWAWARWGCDGLPCGERGLFKSKCLDEAHLCFAATEGEVIITNFVPVERGDWRKIYAV